MNFKFKQHHTIETDKTVTEARQLLYGLFESGDVLKHEQFDKKYRDYPGFILEGLKTRRFINNPALKYLGSYDDINFTLTSPFYLYWKHIDIFPYQGSVGAKIQIDFNYFNAIMLSTLIYNLITFVVLVTDWKSGITPFAFGVVLAFYFLVRYKNAVRYLEEKIGLKF